MQKLTLLTVLLIIMQQAVSQNIAPNGNFEAGLSNWSYWFDGANGYNGIFQSTTTNVYSGSQSGEILITSIGATAEYHRVMVKNTGFALESGKEYDVSFYLKSSIAGQTFQAQIHKDSSPFTQYSNNDLAATTSWQQYSFNFTSSVTSSDVRFALKLGNSVADYYIDELVITETTPTVYPIVIDPAYSIDWSKAGYPGEIPAVPNVLNVLDFGAVGDGVTDDFAEFQNAIDAANYGEAVLVPAGDYLLNGTLELKEGVVLRGECPSNTRLFFDNGGASVSCIDAVKYDYGTFVNVTAGLAKGSITLMVADASEFSPGGYAELQQNNDPLVMYTDPLWDQSWAANAVGQLLRIAAISGNQLTLETELHLDFDPSLNPQIRAIGLIEEVGIENLYIEKLDAGNGNTIQLKNAARCWVRNVESNRTYRSHVSVTRAMNCEITGSYMHHSHDYGGGGHGYGVDLITHSTSNLIENNVFEHLRHSMLVHVGANGNVCGYNYSTDPYWSNSLTDIPPDISMHGHYFYMNLFEGNIVQEAHISDHWGPGGPGNTLFRNRVETDKIYVSDHSHNSNVIANELTGSVAAITIEPSVNNTWRHSNIILGNIDNTTTASLPASLYLLAQPDFLTDFDYPVFGPDVVPGANTIPAEERFLNGTPMSTCLAQCNTATTGNSTVNATTVSLSWNPVAGSIGCMLRGRKIGASSWRMTPPIYGMEPTFYSLDLSQVDPGANYEWQVACACSISPLELTDWSSSDVFTTPSSLLRLQQNSTDELESPNTTDAFKIQLYPNPVQRSRAIKIHLQASGSYKAMLFNAYGRMVDQFEVSGDKTSYDCTGLEPGLYWLKLAKGDLRTAAYFMIAE